MGISARSRNHKRTHSICGSPVRGQDSDYDEDMVGVRDTVTVVLLKGRCWWLRLMLHIAGYFNGWNIHAHMESPRGITSDGGCNPPGRFIARGNVNDAQPEACCELTSDRDRVCQ
jgi:hypothetical protein